MMNSMPLLVLTLATALAAPAAIYDDYTETVPPKRSALVLDRLLIALRKALNEDERPQGYERSDRDEPRTAPLRITEDAFPNMALNEGEIPQGYARTSAQWDGPRTAPLRIAEDETNDVSSPDRRGHSNPGRGRVLRCYFNAVTCF